MAWKFQRTRPAVEAAVRVTRTRKRARQSDRDPDTDPEVVAMQAEYDRQARFEAMWSQRITDRPDHGYDALDYLPYGR